MFTFQQFKYRQFDISAPFGKVINNYRRPSIITGFGSHVEQPANFISVCILLLLFSFRCVEEIGPQEH